MPTLTRVQPVTTPVEISAQDGVILTTQIVPEMGKHYVKCHRWQKIVHLTVAGPFASRGCESAGTRSGSSNQTNSPNPPCVMHRVISVSNIPTMTYARTHLCPGVRVKWTARSIWRTYAHLHIGNLVSWYPIGVHIKDNIIFLRDIKCFKRLSDDSPCHKCCMLSYSKDCKSFESRAHELQDCTLWMYFTPHCAAQGAQ